MTIPTSAAKFGSQMKIIKLNMFILKHWFMAILTLLVVNLVTLPSAFGSLSPTDFVTQVKENFRADELRQALQKKFSYQEKIPSVFENPEVQVGKGILEYNAGQGVADYQEFSVVQSLNVSGTPNKKRQIAKIESERAKTQWQQANLVLLAEALLIATEASFASEKLTHVEHRQEHLELIAKYLKSRKFNSPKKQLERQLLKVKMDEINLENKIVIARNATLQNHLRFLLNSSAPVALNWKMPGQTKIRTLLNKLAAKPTFEQKIIDSNLEVAHLEKTIVGRQWIPDLQLYYNRSEEQFFGGNKMDVFGLGVSVPVFDMGRNRRALAAANVKALKLKAKQSQMSSQWHKKKLIEDVSLAMEALKIYSEKTIQARESAFLKASGHFRKGQIDAQSFLDFEHEAHMARAQRFQYQRTLLKSLLGLVAVSGDESLLLEVLQ
jgi:hypothetical protein